MVNLSNALLSPAKVSLLLKGLCFCPTPPRLNSYLFQQDFPQFVCRIQLKEYFYNEEEEDKDSGDQLINPFRKKFRWIPPSNRDIALETYVKAIKHDIDEVLRQLLKRHRWDNLTRRERRALKFV